MYANDQPTKCAWTSKFTTKSYVRFHVSYTVKQIESTLNVNYNNNKNRNKNYIIINNRNNKGNNNNNNSSNNNSNDYNSKQD